MMQRELYIDVNVNLRRKFYPLAKSGVRKFDFLGGRRSGKTWFILQTLLGRVLRYGDVINVATMTNEQGRLGAYADLCDIVNGSPSLAPYVEVLKSPRELRCTRNGGRMFFNTYPDPEHAKGIACDWLYMNEANNFTERQYIDLSASVRKGTFADRNPNAECFTESNGFALIHSTWLDNVEHLTPEQRAWFEGLKAKAESPKATSADVALYRMYYLGQYAEVQGEIFTPANIRRGEIPKELQHVIAYCDPSALWGNDYFAGVLSGVQDGTVYVPEAFSVNEGTRDDIVLRLKDWERRYKDLLVVIETNGYIGQEFYRYIVNTFPRITYVNQSRNKFERIMANYENITGRMVFADTPEMDAYLSQVYTFGKKCEHDDNIDAIDTSFSVHRWQGHIE